MGTISGFSVHWDASGIDFNGAGILALGAPGYTIFWGDGTQQRVEPNRDDDGDGVNEAAHYFHTYGTGDGVYDITIKDRPNTAPDVRMRAYMFNGDPDGTPVTGSKLQDMVLTGEGADDIKTLGENDWVDANGGNDTVDGGKGDDFILGGSGADRLLGGDGNDYLFGGFGLDGADDFFSGGDGNDTLASNEGKATLMGGNGGDTFAFYDDSYSSNATGVDLIKDFEQGADSIYIGGGVSGLTMVGAFSGGGGAEVMTQTTGGRTQVYVDLDGDGAADTHIAMNGVFNLSVESGSFLV